MWRRNIVASLLIEGLSAEFARSRSLVAQSENVSDSGRSVVGRMVLPTNFKGRIDMAHGHGSLVVSIPRTIFLKAMIRCPRASSVPFSKNGGARWTRYRLSGHGSRSASTCLPTAHFASRKSSPVGTQCF